MLFHTILLLLKLKLIVLDITIFNVLVPTSVSRYIDERSSSAAEADESPLALA